MTLPDFSHHYSTLFATIRQEKRNAKARTAGYRVEKSTLEEESGYTLVEDTPAQPGGFGGFGNSQTPLQLHAKALQNARKGAGATSVPPEGETRLEAILGDFAQKLGEEMLEEMALKSSEALESETPVENSTDANGAEHAEKGSGNGGQFVSKDSGGTGADAQGESGDKGDDEKKIKLEKKRERVAAEELEANIVRSVPHFRKHPNSNKSAQACGYKSLDDMLDRAGRISEAKVNKILSDSIPKRCTAAEGVAVLASNPVIIDKSGHKVEVGENQIEKYCTGRFRALSKKTGKPLGPKVGNFEVVPYMLAAIKSDENAETRVKYAKGTTPDPLNRPFGSQREYKINTDRGPMHVFVYIKSTNDPKKGRINGWFVEGDDDGEL